MNAPGKNSLRLYFRGAPSTKIYDCAHSEFKERQLKGGGEPIKINPTPDAVKGREIYLLRALCRELYAEKLFQRPRRYFKNSLLLLK